ncbi:MAG: YihY/virulence factor BrkB family protein [Chitinophagales bacterium]
MALFDKILEHSAKARNLLETAKEASLPGLQGVPVYYVVQFFIHEIKRDVLIVKSKAIAFSFFLALFPALIFLLTLIPYIPIDGLQENMIVLLRDILPANAYELLDQTLTDTIQRPRGGLLSIGFLTALFISSSGMIGVMESFDKSIETFHTRNALQMRWVAFKLTFVIFFLTMISVALIVEGNRLLEIIAEDWLKLGAWSVTLLSTFKWLIILFLIFNTYSFIYYYGPATKKKWNFMSTGSTVATILTIIFSLGFSYFVNNFGTYNKLYGSIGTIIALQFWIYLNSFALLIGFEINASITYNKHLILKKDDEALAED